MPRAYLLWTFVLLLTVSATASAQGEERPTPLFAPGLADEVRSQIHDLGHHDWETRDRAERGLIAGWRQWINKVPQGWEPAEPEAAWRWERVVSTVRDLLALPTRLERDSFESIQWQLVRVHKELGGTVVPDAVAPILERPEERLRVRALRLIARLDGVDPRPYFEKVIEDSSPWVIRWLFDIAIERDREWAEDAIRDALDRPTSPMLRREIVQAARRHGGYGLLQAMRKSWKKEPLESRFDVALAIVGRRELADREILGWMLESQQYRLQMPALREFAAIVEKGDISRLAPLLDSPHFEVRSQAGRLIARVGSVDDALLLVPLLDDDRRDLVEFAARQLVRWGAEDFFSEVEAALARLSAEGRTLKISTREGKYEIVEAPARLREVGVTHAIEPGQKDD